MRVPTKVRLSRLRLTGATLLSIVVLTSCLSDGGPVVAAGPPPPVSSILPTNGVMNDPLRIRFTVEHRGFRYHANHHASEALHLYRYEGGQWKDLGVVRRCDNHLTGALNHDGLDGDTDWIKLGGKLDENFAYRLDCTFYGEGESGAEQYCERLKYVSGPDPYWSATKVPWDARRDAP